MSASLLTSSFTGTKPGTIAWLSSVLQSICARYTVYETAATGEAGGGVGDGAVVVWDSVEEWSWLNAQPEDPGSSPSR